MLVSFVLGLGAGWGAPHGEDHVRRLLAKGLNLDESAFQPVELRAVTLVVALFIAALVAWVISYPSAVALTFGAVVGVLAPRLSARIKAARAPDYDS